MVSLEALGGTYQKLQHLFTKSHRPRLPQQPMFCPTSCHPGHKKLKHLFAKNNRPRLPQQPTCCPNSCHLGHKKLKHLFAKKKKHRPRLPQQPTCCPTSCHPGPVGGTVSMRIRDFHKGSSSHQNMRPRGSEKVSMIWTSEYTLIIMYCVNRTWVNRQGFWWWFPQGQIQQMSMCILWAVDEKPCSQLQNGLYLRFLRGQIRHILIWPSNFSFHWMWSIKTSFQTLVYCG